MKTQTGHFPRSGASLAIRRQQRDHSRQGHNFFAQVNLSPSQKQGANIHSDRTAAIAAYFQKMPRGLVIKQNAGYLVLTRLSEL